MASPVRTWLPVRGDGASTLEQAFGLRPDLAEPFRAFYAIFWRDRLVDPVVLELCRLRVARLLGCESELAVRYRPAVDAGLDESLVARLAQWPDDPGFDEAQRAAIAFAEQFVIDPHGIRVPVRDALREHFTLPEVVALTEALALFDGFMRFRTILGEPDLGEPDLAEPDLGVRMVDPARLDGALP